MDFSDKPIDYRELITVKYLGAGGYEVSVRFNGYSFQFCSGRDKFSFQTQNIHQTDEFLQILEGILEDLKADRLARKILKILQDENSEY